MAKTKCLSSNYNNNNNNNTNTNNNNTIKIVIYSSNINFLRNIGDQSMNGPTSSTTLAWRFETALSWRTINGWAYY